MEHEIPPITDPMGAYWEQPDRADILVDDRHAVMTKATYDKLASYNTSVPSGTYGGKMWKRTIYPQTADGSHASSGEVYLCWYQEYWPVNPGKIAIKHRLILLV